MKYSDNIMKVFREFDRVYKEYKTSLEELERNETYSEQYKADQKAEMKRTTEAKAMEHKELVVKAFAEYRDAAKIETKADPATLNSVLVSIATIGKAMTPAILSDIMRPIKEDMGALRQISATLDNLNMGDVAKSAGVFDVLKIPAAFEMDVAQAEKEAKGAFVDWSNSFRFAITEALVGDILTSTDAKLDEMKGKKVITFEQ